jgi:hypothetical protein
VIPTKIVPTSSFELPELSEEPLILFRQFVAAQIKLGLSKSFPKGKPQSNLTCDLCFTTLYACTICVWPNNFTQTCTTGLKELAFKIESDTIRIFVYIFEIRYAWLMHIIIVYLELVFVENTNDIRCYVCFIIWVYTRTELLCALILWYHCKYRLRWTFSSLDEFHFKQIPSICCCGFVFKDRA